MASSSAPFLCFSWHCIPAPPPPPFQQGKTRRTTRVVNTRRSAEAMPVGEPAEHRGPTRPTSHGLNDFVMPIKARTGRGKALAASRRSRLLDLDSEIFPRVPVQTLWALSAFHIRGHPLATVSRSSSLGDALRTRCSRVAGRVLGTFEAQKVEASVVKIALWLLLALFLPSCGFSQLPSVCARPRLGPLCVGLPTSSPTYSSSCSFHQPGCVVGLLPTWLRQRPGTLSEIARWA